MRVTISAEGLALRVAGAGVFSGTFVAFLRAMRASVAELAREGNDTKPGTLTRDGRAAVRLLPAARRQVGRQATRAGGLRRDVQQDVAAQSALSLHADVRAELGRPRHRRAARCLLEIRRGRLRAHHRAVARSRDLQNGRQQRAIRSDAHGRAAARSESRAR